ncbi:hypothetical protein LCGC14_1424810 [marine sediment metagenome]|uniref:Uncharacterized protein n=1 Tax=marine sediment metagenome TaxID=412755 RepID=A0A0F9M5T0_9ZZZZ
MELNKLERKAMFRDYYSSILKKPKESLSLECKRFLLEDVKLLERILKRLESNI